VLLPVAREALAFPLDYPTLEQAKVGMARVASEVGVLKVGLELFVREGPSAVEACSKTGCSVFLDLKLSDIPETVRRAVASTAALGVRYLTVHATGGPHMLEAAANEVAKSNSPLTLLAVTVLTSLDAGDLAQTGVEGSVEEQVLRLARLAQRCGIGGLVSSPRELPTLRQELGTDMVFVTPGIRPAGSGQADDQKRVATPEAAIRAGSSLLVVGRPIRDATDPALAARGIVEEIARAQAAG
jgi:orotidine-5'-phosphate decarboxylase